MCDEGGCYDCEAGYWLDKSGEKPRCVKCDLENCAECSSADVCTRCTHSFYRLHDDGKCRCEGGNKAKVDQDTGRCGCQDGYFLTPDGCKTCEESIYGCSYCVQSFQQTQIPLADGFLKPNGRYMKCQQCVSNYYFNNYRRKTETTEGYSSCDLCSERQSGCGACYADRNSESGIACRTCSSTHYREGGECKSCELAAKHCVRCSDNRSCTLCRDGYHYWFGQCNKNWFT